MFRHPIKDDIETNPEKLHVNEESVKDVVEKNFETPFFYVDEEDATSNYENEISNKTFNNSSQVDNASDDLFKCEICDFSSARK